MADLKGAHIFSAGTWNDLTFSEADLDQIVAAFDALQSAGRVPLKFGHNDEQPITDGQPALGWVSRVWRDGKKLLADFTGVPSVVFQAIKDRLYQFVSIELLRNAEREGVKYPAVLDAVALLGADPPAVTNLDSLSALAMSRKGAELSFQARVAFTQGKISFNQSTGVSPNMDKAELDAAVQAALQPLTGQLNELRQNFSKAQDANKALSDENAKLKADLEARNKKERDEKVAANKDRFTKTVEKAVRAEAITPAQRDKLVAKFTKDEDTILAIDFEDLELMCKTKAGPANQRQGFTRNEEGGELREQAVTVKDEVMKEVYRRKAAGDTRDIYTMVPAVMRENPHLAREVKAHFIDAEAV